jgi:hypothetical protein
MQMLEKLMKSGSIVAIALLGEPAYGIEKLGYEVLRTIDKVEVRRYDAHVTASVVVSDTFEDAGGGAFRELFGYIDGGNAAGQDISMTSPVLQAPDDDGWTVSFVLPADVKPDQAPAPISQLVVLKSQGEQIAAVLKYSGSWSENRYLENEAKLREVMADAGLQACGEAMWARYNPPFTPWFLRTNEVLIPLCETL